MPQGPDLLINACGAVIYLFLLGWAFWLARDLNGPAVGRGGGDLRRFARAARLPWWAVAVALVFAALDAALASWPGTALWGANVVLAGTVMRSLSRLRDSERRLAAIARSRGAARAGAPER